MLDLDGKKDPVTEGFVLSLVNRGEIAKTQHRCQHSENMLSKYQTPTLASGMEYLLVDDRDLYEILEDMDPVPKFMRLAILLYILRLAIHILGNTIEESAKES